MTKKRIISNGMKDSLIQLTNPRVFFSLALLSLISLAFALIVLFPNNKHQNVSRTDLASSLTIKNASQQKCNYGSKGPRILCCVITHFGNLETKVVAVNNTWGKNLLKKK